MTDDMQREAFANWFATSFYATDSAADDGDIEAITIRSAAINGWQAAIRHMREQEDKA